jgi:hypothetical protein
MDGRACQYVYSVFFWCITHTTLFLPAVVPPIFSSRVPQVKAHLADVDLPVLGQSFERYFVVPPCHAVECVLGQFLLLNDVVLHFPVR